MPQPTAVGANTSSGGGPGTPLEATHNYPGMAVPKDGWCVPSDAPGFGHGHTLESIEAMKT